MLRNAIPPKPRRIKALTVLNAEHYFVRGAEDSPIGSFGNLLRNSRCGAKSLKSGSNDALVAESGNKAVLKNLSGPSPADACPLHAATVASSYAANKRSRKRKCGRGRFCLPS
jgi:hypothetical protein